MATTFQIDFLSVGREGAPVSRYSNAQPGQKIFSLRRYEFMDARISRTVNDPTERFNPSRKLSDSRHLGYESH